MYAAGVKNIDVYFIITEVAGPVILFLSLSVVTPYVMAESLSSIPGNYCHCVMSHLFMWCVQACHVQCSTLCYELFIH